jgi:spore coat protein CotH
MNRWEWLGVAAWAGLCGCGGGVAASAPSEEPPREFPQALANGGLYDESRVVDLRLHFTSEQWARFQALRAEGRKEYVHCSLSYGGVTFPDAACRSKGSPEVWPDEPKPEFVIAFNHWDKKGRFNGLRKLNLEANPYRAAPVRDRLGMWLMREAGLPAPRANHARVFVNRGYLGLYQNIEVIDKEFLEDHFENPEGNLYENGSELKTNEEQNDLTHLWELEDLIDGEPLEATDHSAFYAELEQRMDMPQVLRELAAEALLPTPDNFSNGSTNFYYYDNPDHGFQVLPWDLDSIIGEFAPPDADIYEYWGGEIGGDPSKLRLLINQNPTWRAEFENLLVELRDGPYSRLPERAAYYCSQIREAFDADPNKPEDLEAFDADCADIQQRIRDRIDWLESTLGR